MQLDHLCQSLAIWAAYPRLLQGILSPKRQWQYVAKGRGTVKRGDIDFKGDFDRSDKFLKNSAKLTYYRYDVKYRKRLSK